MRFWQKGPRKEDAKLAEERLRIGQMFLEVGNLEKAMDCFNKAVAHDRRLAEAYYFRARVFSLTGLEQDALKDLNKALRLNREFAAAYNARGRILARTFGRWEEAIEDFRKAITLGMRQLKRTPSREGLPIVIADSFCGLGLIFIAQLMALLRHSEGPIDPRSIPSDIPRGIALSYLLALKYNPADEEAQSALTMMMQQHKPLLEAHGFGNLIPLTKPGHLRADDEAL